MLKFTRLLALVCLAPAALSAAEAVIGQVRPQKLNVRIQPIANAGVVDKLPRGTKVKVVGVEGAWYKIELPSTADAYVNSDYLKDNQTTARVQLRHGPGVAFPSYGVLPVGAKVEVLSDKNPQWTKIKPPAGFHAYVASPHVALSDADYQKISGIENAVAPSNRGADEVAVVKASPPEETAKYFERMRAWFGGEPPAPVTLSGEVLKTDNANSGAAYALVTRNADGQVDTVLAALFTGKVNWENWQDLSTPAATGEMAVDLAPHVSKKVKIEGKRLNVQSWSYPYIVVEKVEAAK